MNTNSKWDKIMDTIWLRLEVKLNEVSKALEECLEGTAADWLTVRQVHILAAMYIGDGKHASDVARAVGISPTSATPIFDKLERAELIKRVPDTADRRAVWMYLEPKAWGMQEAIEAALADVEKRYGEVLK